MGRRKSYERDEVLGKAMRLFWERGFHATSTRDLAGAMGVNVYSLYAEFGSKEGLYEAALRRYDDEVVGRRFGRLETSDAGLEAVRQTMRYFGRAAGDNNPMLGCLACNAISEQAPTSTGSRLYGADFTMRLVGAFRNALTNAQQNGELESDAPVVELAHFLTVTLVGVFVMLRAGGEQASMVDAVEQAIERVQAFSIG
jgi:TetR/AcrR family transcriptional repressor of nem operon